MSNAILRTVYQQVGVEIGEPLPKYAWPGGYPIIYFDRDSEIVCADCATKHDWSDARIVAADIHYEGPDEICANCNVHIPSAYGDSDECSHCGHLNAMTHGLQSAGAIDRHCSDCQDCKEQGATND